MTTICTFESKRWSVAGLMLMWVLGMLIILMVWAFTKEDIVVSIILALITLVFGTGTFWYLSLSEKEWQKQYNEFKRLK